MIIDNLPLNQNSMRGATSEENGAKGFVPAPLIEDRNKYLKGDGTWSEVPPSGDYNIIESITVNGVTVPITDKNAAITVMDNTVNNLTNYYLKTDTYTQTEINNLISTAVSGRFEVVNTLPTEDISTKTIYLVPISGGGVTGNVYDEYIYVNNAWEKIGTTQIDISGKADKVSGATSGNFAGLDANGNLTDSGKKASDFVTSVNTKTGAVTLNAADVGALPNTYTAPVSSVNGATGIVTKDQVVGTNSSSGSITKWLNEKGGFTTPTANDIGAVDEEYINVYGSKNLLTYPPTNSTPSPYTANGVTFTDNGDGTYTVDGTASAETVYRMDDYIDDGLAYVKGGYKYLLSGNPLTTASGIYIFLRAYYNGGSSDDNIIVICYTTESVELDLSAYPDRDIPIRCGITVNKDKTANNLLFKPMLRLASIKDDTWEPFVPTNKLLAQQNKGVYIGTCETAAATAAKVVTISTDQNFQLKTGAMIIFKCTYTNTASNVTINVNNTGARQVWVNGHVKTDIPGTEMFGVNRYPCYIYDGQYWIWQAGDTVINTTYSTMSTSEMITGTATAARSMSAKNLSDGLTTMVPEKLGINSSSGSTTKWLNQKGTFTTPTAADVGAISSASTTATATLVNTSWGSTTNAQSLSITGMTASKNAVIGLNSSANASQKSAAAAAQLVPTGQATNSITITYYGTKPSVNIPVDVIIFN